MHIYEVTRKDTTGARTVVLTLQPQNQGEHIDFYPGQYVALSFRANGRPTPMRCFSVVSTPKDPYLQVAMRIQGRFTAAADSLEIGDEVKLAGPFGQFVINPEYDRSIVMLAGGIGITPFMSMLRYAAQLRDQTPITLLYSCRNMRDIPFLQELVTLQRQNPRLTVIFFVTDGSAQPVAGATVVNGSITRQAIEQLSGPRRADSTYFICGPKGFLHSIQRLLKDYVGEDRIIAESFTQATKLGWGNWSIPKLTYAMTALLLLAGTGFIMALDLSRVLPKTVSAQGSAGTPATTQPSQPSQSSSSTSGATPANAPAASTPSSNYSAPTQTYYQPVTSVS